MSLACSLVRAMSRDCGGRANTPEVQFGTLLGAFFFFFNFIYLMFVVLGLHCCQGYSSDAECGLLIVVASLVSENGF